MQRPETGFCHCRSVEIACKFIEKNDGVLIIPARFIHWNSFVN
jgi:hypothetical protein